MDDSNQYYDFFDISKVPQEYLNKPLYIHLDMSITGDKTGIAGTWIIGKKPPVEGQPPSKELFYQLAFVVSIKAPKGHQISFEKNRQFIYWLREQGFNIRGVSFDTYQSADLNQQLMAKGFETSVISVDRVTDRVCLPYQYLKSTIYEERLKLFNNKLLTEELIGLERNNNNGKIDHTPSGINSKDSADALCGSIWNASQHAEEYDFEFGDTLDAFIDATEDLGLDPNQQQVVVSFEEELKKATQAFHQDAFSHMGIGRPVSNNYDNMLIYDGIII